MMKKYTITQCNEIAKKIRSNILNMSYVAGASGSHLGGSLSIVEIVTALYCNVMNYDVSYTTWEYRDRFILSKGHGVPALYCVLSEIGLIDAEELNTFKSDFSRLSGHPSMNSDIGIEFSSGSLGQGLSLGVGSCLGLIRKNNFQSRVFVLLGDGECNEGQIWEAAECAAHYNLSNLVAIVDRNKLQYDGTTDSVMNMNVLEEKWKSFGWNVAVVDGHSVEKLIDALSFKSDKPYVVIADTIKGKGVSFMENEVKWHHSILNKKQFDIAIKEVLQ